MFRLFSQGILFSGSESFRTDSSSPACTSLSPPVKEESLEAHTSDEGDRDRICSPERSPEAPGFRRKCNQFFRTHNLNDNFDSDIV